MLYQPTNLIPSAFAGEGNDVIDAAESNVFSALMTGSSSTIWAYQLHIMKNDESSTDAYDTGVVQLADPFYPMNYNGVQNRLEITVPSYNDDPSNLMRNEVTDGYKWTLSVWESYDAENPDDTKVTSVEQFFWTKTASHIQIDAGTAPATITTRENLWKATYNSTSSVQWFQWTLAEVVDGNYNVVYQTKRIYGSSQIWFEYSGLVSDRTYAVQVQVVNQYGQSVTSAWAESLVHYDTVTVTGATGIRQTEEGVQADWAGVQYIEGEALYKADDSPSTNYQILDDYPINGQHSLDVEADTYVRFESSPTFTMEMSDEGTFVWAGKPDRYDPDEGMTLLQFVDDNDTVRRQLRHEGFVPGLEPDQSGMEKTISNVPVATFYDGVANASVSDIEVGVEFVQDNEYDQTWPAGWTKNLIDASKITNGKYIPADGGTPPGTPSTSSSAMLTDYMPVVAGDTYTYSCTRPSLTNVTRRFNYFANGVWQSQDAYQGNTSPYVKTVTIPAGCDSVRISILQNDDNFQFEHGSTATPYIPYKNVVPISGWTGSHIADDPVYTKVINWNQGYSNSGDPTDNTVNGVTFRKNGDGSYTLTGKSTSSSAFKYTLRSGITSIKTGDVMWVRHKAGVDGSTNTFSVALSTNNSNVYRNTSNAGAIFRATVAYTHFSIWIGPDFDYQNGDSVTVWPQYTNLTTAFGAEEAQRIFELGSPDAASYLDTLFYLLHYPRVDGEYTCVSAVNGDPYRFYTTDWTSDLSSVAWTSGSMIYGGTYNYTTGLITVTHVAVDMGDLTWTDRYTGTTQKAISADINATGKYFGYTNDSPYTATEQMPIVGYVVQVNALGDPDNCTKGMYWLKSSSIQTPGTIYAVVGINEAPDGLLVYKLNEPQTVSLSAQQATMIADKNNFFSDTGDIISLKYGAGHLTPGDPLEPDNGHGGEYVYTNGDNTYTQETEHAPYHWYVVEMPPDGITVHEFDDPGGA